MFGSNNFVADIACVNNPKGRSDDKYIATAHENILIYKKGDINLGQFEPEEKVVKRYREIDEAGEKYRTIDLRKTGDEDERSDREDMFYPFFYNETNKELRVGEIDDLTPENFIRIVPMKSKIVEGRWCWGKNDSSIREGFYNLEARYMPQKRQWTIFERDYLRDKEGVTPTSIWTFKDVNSERGTEFFTDLGFEKTDFPNPKPVGTIERILKIATNPGDIILDSFAGSGTTAHAVLNMNKADGGDRRFILVEMEDYAENITAERVRRVIDGYGDVSGTGGGFEYYELGEPLMFANGNLNESVDTAKIREYVWYMETKQPTQNINLTENPYLLGGTGGTAYYFHYEKDAVTTLDAAFLATVSIKAERYVIYADQCGCSDETLNRYNIAFKKIPRDITRL